MAKNTQARPVKPVTRKISSYAMVHKLMASVGILMFMVIMINGLKNNISMSSIVFKSTIVLVILSMISRVVIKVLKTYEEMNSD